MTYKQCFLSMVCILISCIVIFASLTLQDRDILLARKFWENFFEGRGFTDNKVKIIGYQINDTVISFVPLQENRQYSILFSNGQSMKVFHDL